MGSGRNHNFVIQTRQKDDELFRLKEDAGSISAGGTVAFPIRRVLGYGSIRFLAVSAEILRLRIEEASAPEGPWVETSRAASVASTSGSGQQVICADIAPCSVFMRIFLDNVGVGAASAELSGFGHPVSGGGGGGGGGGGPSSIVELKDGNAGVTRASVKTDGTLINGQGSVLAGGRDPGGIQRALAVTTAGQVSVVLPNRAAFTTDQKTVAVPGTAEQFQAQAVPDGFTIFLEALDGNTGNVYIGGTKADAENHAKANVLSVGAFRTLALTNTNEIWIDADVATEGVQWTVEI